MTGLIRLILIASFCLSFGAGLAQAAPLSSGNGEKIDISAEQSLEWYRDQKLYVARGDARAVHGDLTVEADILTAKQKEAAPEQKKEQKEGQKDESGGIAFLTAEGNVKIVDPRQQVYGAKAVYDLDNKNVTVTGPGLKYVTAQNVVTADDSLEYNENTNIAVARGHAMADHLGDRIEADVLTAFFTPSASGQKEMDHMTARGHVIVVTRDGGISRGEKGYYDAKKDVAYLMDRVRITKGDMELAGDRAEVNFATGQSRLVNSGSGRVHALLPSSGGGKNAGGAKKGK